MAADSGSRNVRREMPEWYEATRVYESPRLGRSLWQLASALIPYLGLWVLMLWMLREKYAVWLLLPPIVVAAGLLVRLFIFFHDCTHCSFFAPYWANRFLGYVLGILTFTPYEAWQRDHDFHHSTYADLDARGRGDITLLTVEEYRSANWRARLAYWIYRNPLVMLCVGPAYIFLVSQRIPPGDRKERERFSVIFTDVAVFAIVMVAILTHSLKAYLLIQVPVILLAGAAGVWLFYVQHQFEGVYWARHEQWDAIRAALEGSSYYKLPKVFQWFTGNIGLHPVHHLRPRIPNYRLQECLDGTPALQAVRPLSFGRSLRSLTLNLWDENEGRLISFRALRRKG
jgi:acyl-lipid omega-6 desaturase (Delta-12 desaturase)